MCVSRQNGSAVSEIAETKPTLVSRSRGAVAAVQVPVLAASKGVSRWCLLIAIAALGMKTSLKAMAEVGGRAIALIVAETLFLAILVLVIVVWKS